MPRIRPRTLPRVLNAPRQARISRPRNICSLPARGSIPSRISGLAHALRPQRCAGIVRPVGRSRAAWPASVRMQPPENANSIDAGKVPVISLLEGVCLVVYLLALVGTLFELPLAIASTVRYGALVLLGAPALEVLVAFRAVRRYRGPLLVSIVLTLLFGFLHWIPLARERAGTADGTACCS